MVEQTEQTDSSIEQGDQTPSDHRWYVVQVMSAQEKSIKKSIEDNRSALEMEDLISEVLLPTENVSEVKKGEQKISEKRLWPGYLLVKMQLTDKSWNYISETNGVIGFLGGGQPEPLTDREVEEILSELRSKRDQVTQKHAFSPGDQVRICDGVFVNFDGTIIEVFHDKGRLSVMVAIFGRETRVDDLEFWQVEERTEEEG